MRTLTVLLAGIMTLAMLATPGPAIAQETDVPALADSLSALTPAEIQAALHTPIPDDALPQAFTHATPIDQHDATMQATDAGAAKAVALSLTYTPAGEATPTARTAPRAGGPSRVYNTASVTYLIFEDALTTETVEGFGDILRASIGDQAASAKVQDISIAGQDAFLMTIEAETNGIPIVMEWVAVPVGKVVVLSMAMSGGDSVDRDALLADAQALALSAIAYLQTSVEQGGTPAG